MFFFGRSKYSRNQSSITYRSCFAVLAGHFQLGILVAVVSAKEQVQFTRFGIHR